MSNERKKVIKKTVSKPKPKKRIEAPNKKKKSPKIEKVVEKPKKRKDKVEDKYVRVSTKAQIEELRLISERVQKGELKWAYYAADGDKGYHYYIVLN